MGPLKAWAAKDDPAYTALFKQYEAAHDKYEALAKSKASNAEKDAAFKTMSSLEQKVQAMAKKNRG